MARFWHPAMDSMDNTQTGADDALLAARRETMVSARAAMAAEAPETATVVRLADLEPLIDATHAPAVRAFLADRMEGQFDRQKALARAVVLARRVC